MEIKFVRNKYIDRSKWDSCVENSVNGLFYGRSVVYETLCENWDALILGDYEAVMPLANRRKFGLIPYVYQPYFVQQGGVFSKSEITEEVIEQFLAKIPSYFIRTYLHLNYGNPIRYTKNGKIVKRRSLEIELNKEYKEIESNYNKDARKNLSRFNQLPFEQDWDIKISKVIGVYKFAYGELNPGIQEVDYTNLTVLFKELEQKGKLVKLGLYLEDELMACGLFVKDFGRIHYCLGAPTELGRTHNATHALIDRVIKKFSSQPLVFDFEGSEIPNVASFYNKFGPIENHFTVFKRGL